MSFLDPAYFYRGFIPNIERQQLVMRVNKPEDDADLYKLWDNELVSFKDVNVCLSGGIDSQFVVSVLTKLNKNVKIFIFSLIWEDCVFNSSDVTHAIRYCERFGYNFSLVEIDCEKFFNENKHYYYCKTYDTISPQIALQLHMLDCINNSNPVFLGCDVPMFQYNFKTQKARAMNMNSFPFITLPFLNYSKINKKLIIKELFAMSPELYYLGFKQFVETTKLYKMVIDENFSPPGISQPVRKLLYSNIGATLLPPLLKNTGFETLKMHLAKQTGNYNEFDLRYRYPMVSLLKSEKNLNLDTFKVIVKTNYLNDLLIDFENFCKTTPDIKPIELYNFIL